MNRGKLFPGLLVVFLSACNVSVPDAVPPDLQDVTRIRDNADLTAQQKRAQLADLGLSTTLINAVLQDERLGNQYGGDLRTAYEKVTDGRLNALTPDEVQIYADEASDTDSGFTYDLTDEEAQAIVSFFKNNRIATQDDVSAFLDDPAKSVNISKDIPENSLRDLFVDFDTSKLIEKLP